MRTKSVAKVLIIMLLGRYAAGHVAVPTEKPAGGLPKPQRKKRIATKAQSGSSPGSLRIGAGHRQPIRGFTLIELLIVIAVIAMLTAIALPNFFEAQTRAKVSRTKTDLASIASAMEAYNCDFNSYPYVDCWSPTQGPNFRTFVPGGMPRNPNLRVGGVTSPIAYMTSVPLDAFEYRGPDNKPARYDYQRAGWRIDTHFANATGMVQSVNLRQLGAVMFPADVSPVLNPATFQRNILLGTGQDAATYPTSSYKIQEFPFYVLSGIGPDQEWKNIPDPTRAWDDRQARTNLNSRYDPTNGTYSRGNVVYVSGTGLIN